MDHSYPYIVSLTREPFLFYEMRSTAKLMAEGNSDDVIVKDFKALIYMHRYQPDTIARIRTDYVHEQQARYRTAIVDLEQRIANASTSERVKLNKKQTDIDLDDGAKNNYAIFRDVLAKIK